MEVSGGIVPLVSVVIPTYNHARFVTQAVDSVLAQTYPNVEVVVVDDGSTDETRDLLSRYEGQINYIYQENRGLSAARNTGILAARGDYLLFLDADDLVPANKLELQVPHLEARLDYGLVYSGWQYVNENATKVIDEVRPKKQGHLLKELLCQTFYFPVGTPIIRHSCFDRVGLFDESLRAEEDADMWIRLAKAGYAFGYVDRILFQYRIRLDSMSTHAFNQVQNMFAILDKFFADPDLPGDIKALEPEVYSIAHCTAAARFYRTGEIEAGRDHFRQAISTCPSLASDKKWLLRQISGVALDFQVDDPFAGLDRLFADPELPDEVKRLEAEAYSLVHYDSMAKCYRHGEIGLGREHLRQAISVYPSFNREWLLEWIANAALETDDPCQLIDWFFDSLPPEATALRPIRRRAHSRYHVAAAFLAHQNHQPKEVCRHILPALLGNPATIRNRGFISISLRSLFG
jgi:glycosyltransferase involved in cell wall biosynthesis